MIAYVSGVLKEIEEDSAIVDVGGIGYRVYTPVTEKLMRLGVGNPLTLYTYLCVREDAQLLYGFMEKDTLRLFQKLINVNGVGPKFALAILTQLAPDAAAFAIASGDHKALTKVSGIGVKTAQRIILDLKDKVSAPQLTAALPAQETGPLAGGAAAEASAAMEALGYTQAEARQAVGAVYAPDKTAQQLIKEALKQIAAF